MMGVIWGYHVNQSVGHYESSNTPPRSLYVGANFTMCDVTASILNLPLRTESCRGVVGLVLTHPLTQYPQNPPIINFYLGKNGPLCFPMLRLT